MLAWLQNVMVEKPQSASTFNLEFSPQRKFFNHPHHDPVLLAFAVGLDVLRNIQKQLPMLIQLTTQLWKLAK